MKNLDGICISLASRPGTFGRCVHQAGYEALGLNWTYLPLTTTDLPNALEGVRALGIRGCSLSMPFKTEALPLLDAIDPMAQRIGAVNTVVNQNGTLIGHNTDYEAAFKILKPLRESGLKSVLLLGAGGVARSLLVATIETGWPQITVCTRNPVQSNALIAGTEAHSIDWSQREKIQADLLIQATPLGMKETDPLPLRISPSSHFKAVLDLVVSKKPTSLLLQATELNLKIIHGWEFSLEQALRQFEYYTGHPAPESAMKSAAKEWIASNPI